MEAEKLVDSRRIADLCRQLSDGDVKRLLNFAESMMEQKQGKRQQRSQSISQRKPYQTGWRIGDG